MFGMFCIPPGLLYHAACLQLQTVTGGAGKYHLGILVLLFIIIAAGHIWKVWALAYLPPMIAGVVLAYRGKYLKGLLLTAIFSAFEVQANHVQMTYYYLFIILFMVIAFLADAIKKGELARFGKATAVCVVGALIGISLNLSNLYHTWQYGQETMRGKSELVKKMRLTRPAAVWIETISHSGAMVSTKRGR